jgi:Zn-finger in Ran binding protein and others
MAIREGRWDCSSCGSKAIYGRHVDCPGCGRPRPAGVRFYLAEGEPVIKDPERLREAAAGADWICEACGASNRALLAHCGGCGAPRGTSPTQPVREYGPDGTARPLAVASPPSVKPARRMSRVQKWILGGVAGVWVVAAAADEIRLPRRPQRPPKLAPAVVTALVWEHKLVVEERRLVPDSGRTLPDSALDVVASQVIDGYKKEVASYVTHTRRVPREQVVVLGHRTETRTVTEREESGTRTYTCGQRDLGNGYFEDITCTEPDYVTRRRRVQVQVPITRTDTVYDTVTEREPVYREVPVYATHYRYRAVQWVPVDTLRASGDTTPPVWPGAPNVPGRRAAQRLSWYTLVARGDDGQVHRAWLAESDLRLYRPGQRIALSPARGGLAYANAYPADSLPACRRWHQGRGNPPPESFGCSPRPATARRR